MASRRDLNALLGGMQQLGSAYEKIGRQKKLDKEKADLLKAKEARQKKEDNRQAKLDMQELQNKLSRHKLATDKFGFEKEQAQSKAEREARDEIEKGQDKAYDRAVEEKKSIDDAPLYEQIDYYTGLKAEAQEAFETNPNTQLRPRFVSAINKYDARIKGLQKQEKAETTKREVDIASKQLLNKLKGIDITAKELDALEGVTPAQQREYMAEKIAAKKRGDGIFNIITPDSFGGKKANDNLTPEQRELLNQYDKK